MNWTQAQVDELYRGRGIEAPALDAKPPARSAKTPKIQPVSVPMDVTLTLWGHCPSKKNLWSRGEKAQFLPPEVKEQIESLTTQALFAWKQPGPVEHPEITVKFYVNAARRDRDGMLTTLLDCLQAASVLVNDNLRRCNGRMVVEPADFVPDADERVEIRIRKE